MNSCSRSGEHPFICSLNLNLDNIYFLMILERVYNGTVKGTPIHGGGEPFMQFKMQNKKKAWLFG